MTEAAVAVSATCCLHNPTLDKQLTMDDRWMDGWMDTVWLTSCYYGLSLSSQSNPIRIETELGFSPQLHSIPKLLERNFSFNPSFLPLILGLKNPAMTGDFGQSQGSLERAFQLTVLQMQTMCTSLDGRIWFNDRLNDSRPNRTLTFKLIMFNAVSVILTSIKEAWWQTVQKKFCREPEVHGCVWCTGCVAATKL